MHNIIEDSWLIVSQVRDWKCINLVRIFMQGCEHWRRWIGLFTTLWNHRSIDNHSGLARAGPEVGGKRIVEVSLWRRHGRIYWLRNSWCQSCSVICWNSGTSFLATAEKLSYGIQWREMLPNIPERYQLAAGAICWNNFAIGRWQSEFLIIIFIQLGNGSSMRLH